MNIAVVGTGYVGLVTGTCLAQTGNTVTCIDIDEAKVNRMKKGQIPIYEPGLEELFQGAIAAKRLYFTTSLSEGIKGAEVIFLALPTPPGEDGAADLSYILDTAHKLGPELQQFTVIVDKSTVPVGTAEKVRGVIAARTSVEFDVASNPEFLREGFAVDDFMHPDRIVIGTSSEKTIQLMQKLYQPYISTPDQIIFMDERSAEMTKYAANCFLATKVTFMNEIANLCEQVGANVDAVRLGIGSDERIGKRFLQAGIGYGGSCFPKDLLALHHTAQEHGYDFKTLEIIMDINKRQKYRLVEKVKAYYSNNIAGKTFALWGLAFKPDTDDIREAPSLYMIDALLAAGAKVVAYDPEATQNVKKHYSDQPEGLKFVNNPYEALHSADALLIATEWDVFKNLDLEKVRTALDEPVIFDGRNMYRLEDMAKAGFYYESIGRKVVTPAQ